MSGQKTELLALVEAYKAQYIADEGYREYECLVALVEDNVITTFDELSKYGIDKP